MSSSHALAHSATVLLLLAQEERHRPTSKTPTNHYSEHALGAITLLVSAFDAWLIETLAQRGLRTKSELTAIERYQELELRALTANDSPHPTTNLGLVIEVRNDIEHFRPGQSATTHGLPDYLALLLPLGVLGDSLFHAEHDGIPYTPPLHERLKSYALAYWVFEVVESAVVALALRLAPGQPLMAANFTSFRAVYSPATLAEHDREPCPGVVAKVIDFSLGG